MEDLISFGVSIVTLTSAVARSVSGAVTDHFVKRQVYVCGCWWRPEFFLAFLELLQLSSQQRVLQFDLRACPHLVPLPFLLPQHHLEGFGHSDLGVGPDPDYSLAGQCSLSFLIGGLGLQLKVLLGHHSISAEQDFSERKHNRVKSDSAVKFII